MNANRRQEKYLYEARLKAERDEKARLDQAWVNGFAKGRIMGLADAIVEGQILLCQELLGLPQSSDEELAGLDHAQLAALANELQCRLQLPRS